MQQIKEKDRILREVREKQLVTYKGAPTIISVDSQKKLCRPEGIGNKKINMMKSKNL